MAASAAFSTIFSVLSSSEQISSPWIGSFNVSLAFNSGVKAKFASSAKAIQINGYAKKASTATFAFKSEVAKVEENEPSESRKDVPNFLYLRWFLEAIMSIKVAVEKQRKLFDMNPRRPNLLTGSFIHEQIINNIYVQSLSIKTYEIDAAGKASLKTIMNILQEASINHFKFLGVLDDSFRSYPKMRGGDPMFVVLKMHIHVEHYPSWGDDLEVSTWIRRHKGFSMARDWHICNLKTGQSMIRATSYWALVDKTSRKFSKIPQEIKLELESHCKETPIFSNEDSKKFSNLNLETADYIIDNLTPQWDDLDINIHVNNGKYIEWILKGIPVSMFETHEMSSMVLEFRKECKMGDILQSVTAVSATSDNSPSKFNILYDHQLMLKGGPTLMKGQTTWIQKVSKLDDCLSNMPISKI